MNLGKEVTKFRQKFEMLAEKLLNKEMDANKGIIESVKRKSFYDVQELAKVVRKRG